MNSFKLRVNHTRSGVTVEELRSTIENIKGNTHWIYVQENLNSKTNSHTHWYFDSNIKHPAVANRLRKLSLSGNESYSLTKCSPINFEDPTEIHEYIRYLFKENEPVYSETIPQEYVERHRQASLDVAEEIKSKRNTKGSIWKQILENLDTEALLSVPDTKCDPVEYQRLKLWEIVFSYHIEHEKLIRTHQIKSIVDTILGKINPSYSRYLCKEVYRID